MKKTGNILLIIIIAIVALVVGGWLISIGWALFKIMLGLLGVGLVTLGFYIGRASKRGRNED